MNVDDVNQQSFRILYYVYAKLRPVPRYAVKQYFFFKINILKVAT